MCRDRLAVKPLDKHGKVIERYQRPDSAHWEFEVTIDDPGAYTRPCMIYGHSSLVLNTDLMEYWCIENGAQDLIHLVK